MKYLWLVALFSNRQWNIAQFSKLICYFGYWGIRISKFWKAVKLTHLWCYLNLLVTCRMVRIYVQGLPFCASVTLWSSVRWFILFKLFQTKFWISFLSQFSLFANSNIVPFTSYRILVSYWIFSDFIIK